jgi:hypothetical protein
MYSDGGPPAHQGKPPDAVCALASLASAASRSAFATRGSRTRASGFPVSRPPLAVSSHGVSSSASLRLGSAASQVSRRVSRFDSSSAIFAMAG